MTKFEETNIPIEKSISRNLKLAYNIMHVEFKKIFKDLEISIAQFELMDTILLSKQKALSIHEIASQTVSLQPNTTKNVAELEYAGLVKRSIGGDRRVVMVQVTPKGMQLVNNVQKHVHEFHLFHYQNLSNAERYMLDELLLKISHLPDGQQIKEQ